jgi:carbon-monoxide dehydrogenase medium subunit
VKPAAFEYRRPESLEEALAELRDGGPDAKPLAGGQSLVPLLNLRILRPSLLVDLNRVPGLDGIAEENGSVRVGALVRQGALERSPVARRRLPLVAQCLPHVGHFATRNRGTVGGSVAHADAAGELPLALVALGGSVVATSADGRRELPADDFFVSHFTTALAPGELVVETVWPAASPGWGYAFEELSQRHGDYALTAAACTLRVEDGRVAAARVAVGAVADRPLLVGAPLAGEAVDESVARAVGAAAVEAAQPTGTMHASAAYLRHVTGVLVERAVLRAWRNAMEASA